MPAPTTSLRTYALRALAVGGLLLGAGCATVPFTGRTRWGVVNDRALNAQTRVVFAQIADSVIAPDTSLHRRLDRVSGRLLRAVALYADQNPHLALLADIEWRIVPMPAAEMNAFALPGGIVLVTTAALTDAPTDTALAVLVAHEMAHVICRHQAETYSKLLVGGVAQLAVTVGTIVVPGADSALPRQYAELQQWGYLAHSRKQETEADRVGQYLLALAGWPPEAQAREWARLELRYPETRANGPESTHPGTARRARRAQRWVPEARRYFRAAPVTPPPAAPAPAAPPPQVLTP